MFKEQTKSNTIEDRFIVRSPTLDDMEDVLEMLEITDLTMIGEIEVTAQMLHQDWTNPILDMERNFRVVTTKNGRVVAYGELLDNQKPLLQFWSWNRVHPDFEGQGIGTYLMNWGEKLARQSMVKSPPEARITLYADAPSTYQPTIDLLKAQGMKLVRRFYKMRIDLHEQPTPPQIPENITIRPMHNRDELPAIVNAIQEAFRDHWGIVEQTPEQELERWNRRIETDPAFDPDLWFLAVDGDQIAGFSLCSPKRGANQEMGWVNVLGVLRPWRRQGLGLALIQHSFVELHQRGKKWVGLGVDADSLTGAARLYEKAGMYIARQFDKYEKELRQGTDLVTKTIEE
ncbi:MAG: GNAT family N-acetyltransferase [Candidatus Promineifilaceae bacterium]